MKRFQASVVVAILTVLPGCGALEGPPGKDGAPGRDGRDGADGISTVISGGRIKARKIVTSDGAVATIGWFDAALKMPCAFTKSGDGRIRCLPAVPRSDLERVFYDNNECDGAVVAIGIRKNSDPCNMFGGYVTDTSIHGCDAPTVVYYPGSPFTGDAPKFYIGSEGCSAAPTQDTMFDMYNAVVADPTTTFVEAQETIE